MSSIPGEHFVHPSAPLADELEKVPRGHGKSVAASGVLPGVFLNPEAKRAEIIKRSGLSILIASVRESMGFLENITIPPYKCFLIIKNTQTEV